MIITTLFTGCFFYAQKIEVRDSLSELPLAEVVIKIGNKEISVTDFNGKANLKNLNKVDTLTFSNPDYESKKTWVRQLNFENNNIIYLRQKPFRLDGVMVSGDKWKGTGIDETQHVVRLSKKEIERSTAPTTPDLLSKTGEVYIQKSQLGGGSPMIRGFAANRVLLVIDGIRMNNAIFRSGNLQNSLLLDPFMLENVEVVFGPGSVLYGSDALGGVLNFRTKKGYYTDTLAINSKVKLQFSSADMGKLANSQLQFSNKNWHSITQFSYSNFGDLETGKNGNSFYLRPEFVETKNSKDVIVENSNPRKQLYSGYEKWNILQKISVRPFKNATISYLGMFSTVGDVPRYDRLIEYNDNTLKYAKWYYGPQQLILQSLRFNYEKKHSLFDDFTSHLDYQYYTESRHNRKLNSSTQNNTFEKVNLWSWETVFHKKKNRNNWIYGFDMDLNRVNSSANQFDINTQQKISAPSRYPNGSTWNSFGAYAKWERSFSHNSQWETALRYTFVNSRSKFSDEFYDFPFDNANFNLGALSGSIGAHFGLPYKLKINTNFSTGFRAPNIDDIGKIFDSEPGRVIVPNPNLKPEYLYSLDFGISKAMGQTLFVSLSGYYSWLLDAIVRRPFNLNGESEIIYHNEWSQVQALQNAAHAFVYGGVFALEANILKYYKLEGKLNYAYGREETEDGELTPMRHVSPIFGSLNLIFQKEKFLAQLGYEFNDKVKAKNLPISEQHKPDLYAKDQNNQPFVPFWGIMNFRTQYIINPMFQLSLGVDNIFNKLYRPYSSGISAPGRNFIISLTTSF